MGGVVFSSGAIKRFLEITEEEEGETSGGGAHLGKKKGLNPAKRQGRETSYALLSQAIFPGLTAPCSASRKKGHVCWEGCETLNESPTDLAYLFIPVFSKRALKLFISGLLLLVGSCCSATR